VVEGNGDHRGGSGRSRQTWTPVRSALIIVGPSAHYVPLRPTGARRDGDSGRGQNLVEIAHADQNAGPGPLDWLRGCERTGLNIIGRRAGGQIGIDVQKANGRDFGLFRLLMRKPEADKRTAALHVKIRPAIKRLADQMVADDRRSLAQFLEILLEQEAERREIQQGH
jgi:hypothetical protein